MSVIRLFMDHNEWLRALVIDNDKFDVRIVDNPPAKIRTATRSNGDRTPVGRWYHKKRRGWAELEVINGRDNPDLQ